VKTLRHFFAAVAFLMILSAGDAMTCTSAIVSGKHTRDGRPLMWKHRDTSVMESKLVYLKGEKYDIIALVNSSSTDARSIWIGFNSAGFAIMNTLSYNIEDDSTSSGARNGILMREALEHCANLDDFEMFLRDQERPMRVRANFGVIDAHGGAAYYETNNDTWVKIDVNDPSIAPHGYVVRTNYSYTGTPHGGAGYIRFNTAENLFYKASGGNNLSVDYLLEHMSLSLENSYTGQHINQFMHLSERDNHFIYFQDCINRYTSTSSVVVQGIKGDESPLFTTMWTMIGFPLASVPVPVWINPQRLLPEVLTAPWGEDSPMSDYSLRLKSRMIPSERGSTKYYINTTRVFNAEGSGITQRLLPVHKSLVREAVNNLDDWRRDGMIDPGRLSALYLWADSLVRKSFEEILD
jgi:hypothetical protein